MASAYKKIAESIICDLKAGKYHETKKLPKEEELIQQYGVSRTTIRKSINILVNKGFVYQVQGSGIFVREAALQDYVSLENVKGLTRDFPTKQVEAKLLSLEVIDADEELAEAMQCEVGTKIYYLQRLRSVSGEKFALEYSYFNKDIIPYLSEEIIKSSIYSYIIDDLKLTIGFADKIITATKLSPNEAELLELELGDPALTLSSTVFLSNGTIFEVSKSVHHYKNAKLLKLATF
ncbi:MAG: GntR family transcriptional regulator [Culicoidibacterales bacterium]